MKTSIPSKVRIVSRLALSAVLALCMCHPRASAQTVTGSVTGTVVDKSGALIPNATVTAENVDTGVRTTTPTNGQGVYSIRFLPIGRYRVIIESPGFGTLTSPDFTLEIDQTAKLNETLTQGASTSVEVQSAAPILNTEDSSLGITLSTNEIANIPLNGRNFSSVTLFQPGAVSTDPTGFTGNNAIERTTYNNGVASITATATRPTTTPSTARTRTSRRTTSSPTTPLRMPSLKSGSSPQTLPRLSAMQTEVPSSRSSRPAPIPSMARSTVISRTTTSTPTPGATSMRSPSSRRIPSRRACSVAPWAVPFCTTSYSSSSTMKRLAATRAACKAQAF